MAKKKKNKKAKAEALPVEETDQSVEVGISEEEFEASVMEEEIASAEGEEIIVAKSKRSRAADVVQIALIVVFASVFLVCAVMLAQNIAGKIKGAGIYDEASKQFEVFVPGEDSPQTKHPTLYAPMLVPESADGMQTLYDRLSSGSTDSSSGSSEYSQQLANMKASLSSLRDINDQVYGWIYVPGTRINYPILRGVDNDYYLDHAYNHEVVPIGSIFADFTTKDKVEDNYNMVLYGHNVVSGQMFHDVTNFLKTEVFADTLMYIYTMDGIYVYQPVAIYATTSDNFYYKTEFISENDFVEYANHQIKYSQHKPPKEFGEGDRMLTLSTCTNGTSGDGRYAMHAILIEIIK